MLDNCLIDRKLFIRQGHIIKELGKLWTWEFVEETFTATEFSNRLIKFIGAVSAILMNIAHINKCYLICV